MSINYADKKNYDNSLLKSACINMYTYIIFGNGIQYISGMTYQREKTQN